MSFTTTASILRFLQDTQKNSWLDVSPDEVNLLSIAFIILLFIARNLQIFFGIGASFDQLDSQDHMNNAGKKNDGQVFALPNISLYMPLRLKPTSRQVFAEAIEPQLRNDIKISSNKAQMCLYLAALSEPAMLLLLAKRGCPIRPLGAVNVRNRFEIVNVQLCQKLFEGAASISEYMSAGLHLMVIAKFPCPARRVRRGIEIDIQVSIVANQASTTPSQPEIIEGLTTETIFRQSFTMLQFMRFKDKTSTAGSTQSGYVNQKQAKPSYDQGNENISLSVPMPDRLPYLWARLCKDYNPIHFSPVLARILGQPGQLAHGNHAVGVCLQAMSRLVYRAPQLGASNKAAQKDLDEIKSFVRSLDDTTSNNNGWWMEVRFRRPIVLPATFGPKCYDSGTGFEIADCKTEKVTIEVSTASR